MNLNVISNSKIDVSYECEGIGDIRHSRLDNKKAQKDLFFRLLLIYVMGYIKRMNILKLINRVNKLRIVLGIL